MQTDEKPLGAILREARLRQGKTLIAVAREVKTFKGSKIMTESYLARIENHEKYPSLEVLEQIARELNLSFNKLLNIVIKQKMKNCLNKYLIKTTKMKGE